MKLIKLLFASTFMLIATMTLALLASPVAANDEVEICHVPPKQNQTEPFASGRIVTIPRADCYDHCMDHGGDHAMFDPSCAAELSFIKGKNCVVNSPESDCSTDRCIATCATNCGDCFEDRIDESAGCEFSECEATICAIDPFCCDNSWDNLCVGEAIEFCAVQDNLCE